ncbi:glycoside hydrolase family 18 protein [Mycena rebaudengoi]|nr:glycoside hydrolase family 18 protein [Mycena rebaudengoi]
MFSLLLLPLFFNTLGFAQATSSPQNKKIATAWYTGWHGESVPAFPLAKVSWEKFTHMTYAFAETSSDVRLVTLNGSDPELLPKFVAAAHEHGVKALVSVGGWTGSRFWSSNVAMAENRWNLEAPTDRGIGCNTVDVNDTANFLAFLKELRADPLASLYFLDFIAVMVYDISGPWSAAVGANAPLNDACAPEAQRSGSAVSGVAAWNAAAIPLNQLVLGVASYGHSFRVAKADASKKGSKTELALYAPFDAVNRPVGDAWNGTPGVDVCGNQDTQAKGVPYLFDTCSRTPFVYNTTTEVMISFDNAESIAEKGKFIASKGLAGFAMWEAGEDYKDILVDSLLESMDDC